MARKRKPDPKPKLEWMQLGYTAELVAYTEVNGTKYRIRAVQDQDASNPFEDSDGHWPMIVRYDRTTTEYAGGDIVRNPIDAMSDELLVHDQHAIAKAFGFGTVGLALAIIDCDRQDVRRCADARELREAFDQSIDNLGDNTDDNEILLALWEIAGAITLSATSSGHSQGDYAHLSLLATPSLIEQFRGMKAPLSDDDKRLILQDLQGQVDTYSAWAWGDVYGYIVETQTNDPDSIDDGDWDEIDDGSCWGFYGSDFAESGLEDAALECLPADTTRPLELLA